jgi:hypothetical protein
MAWKCVRCAKSIFRPRQYAIKHAMEWRYVKTRRSLTTDLRNLHDLKDSSVVTHAVCNHEEQEGFDERMRAALGMPANVMHALLL